MHSVPGLRLGAIVTGAIPGSVVLGVGKALGNESAILTEMILFRIEFGGTMFCGIGQKIGHP